MRGSRGRLIWFIWFIWSVWSIWFNQINEINQTNKNNQSGPRVSRATLGAAEVGDDESCVGDGVCRKGGCVLIGYRGAQSLGCLADGKRERLVLLNLPEMGHRIPAPSWNRELRQPRFGGQGHGASGTDSCLPVVVVLPRGLGCREFLFNQRHWRHEEKSFRCAGSAAGHCDQLQIRSASRRLHIRE
jgi:hypothetical protein